MFATAAVIHQHPFTLRIRSTDGSLRADASFDLSISEAEVFLRKDEVKWVLHSLAFRKGRQTFSQPPMLRQVVIEFQHFVPSLALVYPNMSRKIFFDDPDSLATILKEGLDLAEFNYSEYTATEYLTALHMLRIRDANESINEASESSLFRAIGLPIPGERKVCVRRAEINVQGNPMAKLITLEKALRRIMPRLV